MPHESIYVYYMFIVCLLPMVPADSCFPMLLKRASECLLSGGRTAHNTLSYLTYVVTVH